MVCTSVSILSYIIIYPIMSYQATEDIASSVLNRCHPKWYHDIENYECVNRSIT